MINYDGFIGLGEGFEHFGTEIKTFSVVMICTVFIFEFGVIMITCQEMYTT